MASITVNEAAQLTGRSRRGIYRDMKSGQLAYKTDRDGHRRIDTSELERLHGPLRMPDTPSRDTGTGDNAELVEEIRALRAELAGLREEVREMRRLPAPEASQPQPAAIDQPTHSQAPERRSGEPVSFADIEARLAARLGKPHEK